GDVHERRRRRVDLLTVQRERRAATDDRVQLLVLEALLGVLLDDLAADLLGRVGVDAEAHEAEVTPDRPPEEAVRDGDGVELVQRGDEEACAVLHRRRSSSSTTGSIRSIPSTRSSRFSVPAHVANATSRSPS